MKMTEKILGVHDSQLFGIVCETGCGQPLANLLFSQPGASKTIYFTESPYSKHYQDEIFGKDDHRSVSYEKVKKMLNYYEGVHRNSECNFIYVSSFQVGDENNKITTHGWIGLNRFNTTTYYHISIYEPMSRQNYVNKIGEIALDLLCGLPTSYVDIVQEGNIDELLWHHVGSKCDENFLYVTPQGPKRFEDILRESKKLYLYRGSFNPPHVAHQEVYDVTFKKFKQRPIFCISIKTYGKDPMTVVELKKRIEMLLILGFDVLVTKNPLFKEMLSHLRLKYKDDIALLMGSDTFDRYLETTPIDLGVEYVVFQRTGMNLKSEPESYKHFERVVFLPQGHEISSTLIRELLNSDLSAEQKEEKLKEYLDQRIIKYLLKCQNT